MGLIKTIIVLFIIFMIFAILGLPTLTKIVAALVKNLNLLGNYTLNPTAMNP